VTQLFAALAEDDSIRFVGDVARGAACGCRCPSCFSPLVAKQGDAKEWHFAHEGRQERPECLVGAINLLRRLAVEYLHALPALQFPRYKQTARARGLTQTFAEEVGWNAQLVGKPTWLGQVAKDAPVASGRLDNGIDVAIHVEICDSRPSGYPAPAGSGASIAFWCILPGQDDLRKRAAVEEYLRRHGRFIWLHQPDVFGLVEAARKRLEAHASQVDEQFKFKLRRHQEEAGRRWAQKAVTLAARSASESPAPLARSAPAAAVDPAPSSQTATSGQPAVYAWAPSHKPGTSFIRYRFADGTAWVVYTLREGGHAVAPWPSPREDWDQALPAKVGTVDREHFIYRVDNLTSAMLYLGHESIAIANESDPARFDLRSTDSL